MPGFISIAAMGEGKSDVVYAFLHICRAFFTCLVEREHEEFAGQAAGSVLTPTFAVAQSQPSRAFCLALLTSCLPSRRYYFQAISQEGELHFMALNNPGQTQPRNKL